MRQQWLGISDSELRRHSYVQFRGRVARSTEQGADAHIDAPAKKYLGVDKYPYRVANQQRVIYYIEPTSARGMN